MIDTEALRKKVIDLAIQGKLTQQLPEDGDAEELYAQIQEEKAKLIKDGKIKKENPLPLISKDEIPFEIPRNWKWVFLGELCTQITDGTHKTPTYQDEGIPFLSVKNISSGSFDLKDVKYISEEEHAELVRRCNPKKGDVLVCRIGTLGKAITIDFDMEFSIFVSLGLIKTTNTILSDYIVQVINSGYGDAWIMANKAGGAMHTYKINLNSLSLLSVPLPPLAEQKRIVEKIEEIFVQIDIIDALQQKYEFDREILKGKIIDAGIRGKLTEQLPEDGNAEELYAQIQEEKTRLIKEGKIKQEKPFPPISEDEIPFELPRNWKWIRFKDLGQFKGGKTPSMSNKKYWTDGTVPWVTSKDMKQKYIETSQLLISENAARELSLFPPQTILFVVRSGILRRLFPVAILLKSATINQDLKALCTFLPDLHEYVYYMLKGLESRILSQYAKDGTTVNNLMVDALLTMPVPLPPLAEQKRIVERIDALLACIEVV